MALTRDRLRELRTPEPAGAKPAPAAVERTSVRLSDRWARSLSMAWLFGLTAILLLEPPPATTAEPAWVTAAGVFLFASIAATVAGLAMRARWSALTSVAASSVLLAGVVACPVTGHHAFGAWWVAQLVIATTLLAMGGSAALRPSA